MGELEAALSNHTHFGSPAALIRVMQRLCSAGPVSEHTYITILSVAVRNKACVEIESQANGLAAKYLHCKSARISEAPTGDS